jgi:dihydrofolate reductase
MLILGESMRQVVYSVAMSLDGYIAGPRGEADWIVMDPDIDFNAMFARFDAILMGRKTYETTRTTQGGGSMPGIDSYVFSRTLRQEDCRGVTVSDDPLQTVPALKDQSGKDIWLFGGGVLFRSLLELGLVDQVSVAVIPVLLGSGMPLLPDSPRRAELQLVEHQIFAKTGTVSLDYAVIQTTTAKKRRRTSP